MYAHCGLCSTLDYATFLQREIAGAWKPGFADPPRARKLVLALLSPWSVTAAWVSGVSQKPGGSGLQLALRAPLGSPGQMSCTLQRKYFAVAFSLAEKKHVSSIFFFFNVSEK